MKIVKIELAHPDPRVIEEAAAVLRDGGLIVYPTDTAYGLGADALDQRSVEKAYFVKGRAATKPIHVIVKDEAMAAGLVYLNEWGRSLMKKFLPGPLTLIFKRRPAIPSTVAGGLETLGIRIPNCPVTSQLSSLVDFPYTATSANPSAGATPYSVSEVLSQFEGDLVQKIDLILDAGVLPRVLPSTLVDLSTQPPQILREGPVRTKEIEAVLGRSLR